MNRTTEPLTVLCAWHKINFPHEGEYHIAGPTPTKDALISHGICKRCLKLWKKTWPKERDG